MSRKTILPDSDYNTVQAPPADLNAESFDAAYVAEALENARRQLALVATVRAEYDLALGLVIEAKRWVDQGQVASPVIHKDASIPAGT